MTNSTWFSSKSGKNTKRIWYLNCILKKWLYIYKVDKSRGAARRAISTHKGMVTWISLVSSQNVNHFSVSEASCVKEREEAVRSRLWRVFHVILRTSNSDLWMRRLHQRILRMMMRGAQFCIFEMHQCMGQMGECSLRKGVILGNL